MFRVLSPNSPNKNGIPFDLTNVWVLNNFFSYSLYLKDDQERTPHDHA